MRETDRQRERGRDTGRERSRLHAGSLMWDSIPVLWYFGTLGSHPEPKANAQPLSHSGVPGDPFLKVAPWNSRPPKSYLHHDTQSAHWNNLFQAS